MPPDRPGTAVTFGPMSSSTGAGAEARVRTAERVAAPAGASGRAHAIVAEGLQRHFGETEAVAGVDLTVEAGEIYGFLGPNGAGKSTFIRMLCTLLRPTDGRASVAGFDVVADVNEGRLRIGGAPQGAALDSNVTGRELLITQARLYGLHRDEAVRRIDELGDLVDVGALD